jgi:hypothetical protein
MLIQPSKIVTGDILPELPKPEYKALRALERAMQARNWEVVNVLIGLGVYLWQTENGRAMLQRLLHEFRTTAPCETRLPASVLRCGLHTSPSFRGRRRDGGRGCRGSSDGS